MLPVPAQLHLPHLPLNNLKHHHLQPEYLLVPSSISVVNPNSSTMVNPHVHHLSKEPNNPLPLSQSSTVPDQPHLKHAHPHLQKPLVHLKPQLLAQSLHLPLLLPADLLPLPSPQSQSLPVPQPPLKCNLVSNPSNKVLQDPNKLLLDPNNPNLKHLDQCSNKVHHKADPSQLLPVARPHN